MLSERIFPVDLKPLPDQEILVWQVWLDNSRLQVTDFLPLLSPEEQTRAGRFFFENDRREYILCRGLLRELLGASLGQAPASLAFGYGPNGKPFLHSPAHPARVEFNLSHSHGLAIFALSQGLPVGVDVEAVRPLPDEDSFARQFFSASEIAWLAARQGQEKQNDFFKIWTAKEAFYKASGEGLTVPISDAVIQMPQVTLTTAAGSGLDAAGWQLSSFAPASGFQACLAAPKMGFQMKQQWLAGFDGER